MASVQPPRPLARDRGEALYVQLKAALLEMMARMEPNAMIPSEWELCERFQVSRTTVRQAIATLVSEGLLYREQGRGTFVAPPKLAPEGNRALSIEEELHGLGESLAVEILSFEDVAAERLQQLQLRLRPGDRTWRIRRRISAGGTPFAHQAVHMPRRLFPTLTPEQAECDLYDLVEQNWGYRVASAEDLIECVVADPTRSQILGVREGAPLLLVGRVVYNDQRVPLMLTRTFYRADRYRRRMILER